MKRAELSLVEILNDSGACLARLAQPWLGVLWLSVLPLRLLQVFFVLRLLEFGPKVASYGDYLYDLALLICAALLLAAAGRAVFVRACYLAGQGGQKVGAEAWRVPLVDLLTSFYCTLLLEALLWATMIMLLPIPFLLIAAGLAAALCHGNEQPSLTHVPAEIGRLGMRLITLTGLLLVCTFAVFITWINLYIAVLLGFWLAQGVAGLELTVWEQLLRPHAFFPLPAFALPKLLLLLGALLAVEPFWLIAHVSFVQKCRAWHTGEDLRHRFRKLRQENLS